MALEAWTPLAPTRVPFELQDDETMGTETVGLEDHVMDFGPFPRNVMMQVLDNVPVTELPRVGQCSRAMHRLYKDETLWKWRFDRLAWEGLDDMQDLLLNTPPPPLETVLAQAKVPRKPRDTVNLLSDLELQESTLPIHPYFERVRRAYIVLKPLFHSLMAQHSTSSSLLFTGPATKTLAAQCTMLRNMTHAASTLVKALPPGLSLDTVAPRIQQAATFCEVQLRTAFAALQERRDPAADAEMRRYASLAWSLRIVPPLCGCAQPASAEAPDRERALYSDGGYALVLAHLASRPVFGNALPHNPEDSICFTSQSEAALDTKPIITFVSFLEGVVREEGALIYRVFPREQRVELVFLEKLCDDLVTEYISGLFQHALSHSPFTYLCAFSQSYAQMLPLADAMVEGAPHLDIAETKQVLGHIWAQQLEEYITQEEAWVARTLAQVCERWTEELAQTVREHREASVPTPHSAAEKRSFLSKFKGAIMAPAASLPRSASLGIGQLTPSRWQTSRESSPNPAQDEDGHEGYLGLTDQPTGMEDQGTEKEAATLDVPFAQSPKLRSASPIRPLQLSAMLSIDIAMELIGTTRMALQRLEPLHALGPSSAARVQQAAIKITVLFFATLNDAHIQPGFKNAREQIGSYDPARQEMTMHAAEHVGPLILFFELVQIGDTIQQMTHVFFDKVASPLLGKTDFTNAAIREKKRFESSLDESVAEGLSTGVELLVQHVEYIVLTRQSPRDFYPEAGQALDIAQPTRACSECCRTLEIYCDMLASCADKALLDVFYQEIGLRLYAVLCKHLKRQIISLNGGFQVISDLNAYYHFITTLKQAALTTLFAALKRIGSLYIVDDPKELAKMVRDATLSGGTWRPEEMYEFLRSRSDFKSIESNVDAELYGIKIMEDCVVL
ncbi:F-box protein: endocytic membrane traffic, recycling ReCYcling 1 [Malassezia vespertilionis]|uniref:Rcy1p n=1 Tax=Malassezia vespertilionis TaxID=2020962 RepID=A0A2N1J815_9BASI|nr:F-box protein: endocytic membrane traffic, recycling ReCYcling 1 [Malassezia vespertilionis]PKI82701.1 Rcy1p [Malassezia vespertilionis]WFD08612.1 F-box protein: endocytic membrane traffic, recycling ReCYcling 1 [Malassezia vespertilionis]